MDDGPVSIILKIVLLFVLILINAFFAMSEIAIISVNDNKIKRMAEEGNKKAKKLLKLTSDSSSFLSTIQIGVTLAGFLTSASAADNFSDPLATWIQGLLNLQSPTAISIINGVSLVLVTIIISYFSLVLGELVPKKIAMQKSEAISFRVVGILLFVKSFLKFFVKLLSASTNIVLKILRIDPNANEEHVTEEDIRMMADVAEEKGAIESSQKDMIINVFEFDDIVAADVMTHRTDICAVDKSDSLDFLLKEAIENGYSRLPVFDEDIDNIVGIVYVKDLLRYVGKQMPNDSDIIDKFMRPAYFVPESKRCGDLFQEMTAKHIQMSIVVDEYGGTAGLVTIEDLLESIVGNMQDEYDNETEDIEVIGNDMFTMDGTTDIEEVEEILGVELPEGEYDTLGGMIMSMLGRVPVEGENASVETCGYIFTIKSVEDKRIERVQVEKDPNAPSSNSDDEADDDKKSKSKDKGKEKDKEKDKDKDNK